MKIFALAGFLENWPGRIICIGRYCQLPVATEGEFAVTVHDDFRRRGVGAFLLMQLMP